METQETINSMIQDTDFIQRGLNKMLNNEED